MDVKRFKDSGIRAGVTAAIEKNLLPAAAEKQYPGHFTITADASGYGAESTWPGLDSWQMAGAYLRLGRVKLVEDYFEFVRAAQRADGNIPFAILPGETRSDGMWLRGLDPKDVYSYGSRKWIGLFKHWQPKANPLNTLAAVSYILTGAEIFDTNKSLTWLRERLRSLAGAANYLLSLKTESGLISGSGFYTELPPRYGCDGITQCYCVHAFRELARLCDAAGDVSEHAAWAAHATTLTEKFFQVFWRGDHFAEYVHAERGLVDSHGLSDVNWAVVAYGIAGDEHLKTLWPRLMNEPGFWAGDMPTHTVTKPAAYEKWELHEVLPFAAPTLKDVAAMGRVWQLEALACARMQETSRLVEGARKVCQAARARAGYWFERYHLQADGSVAPAGAGKYCEYPAVLVRTVFDNGDVFCG
jgi:hypothetical protein